VPMRRRHGWFARWCYVSWGRTHRLRKRRLQLGVVHTRSVCSGTAARMGTQCVAGNFQIALLMIVGREHVSLARLRQSPSVGARMKDEADAASTTRRVVVCLCSMRGDIKRRRVKSMCVKAYFGANPPWAGPPCALTTPHSAPYPIYP
jgi:hypothetical protein